VAEIEPDATAYVHRRDGRFLVQYDVTIPTSKPDPHFIAALRRVQTTLKDYATGGAYVNYPDRDLPNWAEAYWGKNLPRLQQIKRKYDSRNLFRHAQSIPL
jgi:FAD/FMN-containing dehydrogenase